MLLNLPGHSDNNTNAAASLHIPRPPFHQPASALPSVDAPEEGSVPTPWQTPTRGPWGTGPTLAWTLGM